tara:strand:- start:150 stop:1064 length:915 start_codon:yes stop_codon:yes gene_type:complete
MRIFEDAVGSEILSEFEENRRTKTSCFCLLFHLSNLDAPLEARNRELIQNFIKNEFSDSSGLIFIMNTSDIIFFLPQMNARAIEKIKINMSYCLSDILYGSKSTDIEQYISQYDLGTCYAECYLILKALAEKPQNTEQTHSNIKNNDDTQLNKVTKKDPMFLQFVLNKSYNKDIFVPLLRSRPNRSKKIILIIEDQVFSQKILRNCIVGNYIVESAENAIMGLRMYLKLVPDIVFLDWHLPDINGIEFLKQITKIDSGAYIVMSTANNTSNCVNAALSNGAKGYITKPYNKEKINKNLYAFEKR